MGYYSGQHGRLVYTTVGSGGQTTKTVAAVRNWTFSSSMSTLDVTTLGDTDRRSTNGLRSHKGQCQIFYWTDNVNTNSNNAASEFVGMLLKTSKGVTDEEIGRADQAEETSLQFKIEDGTSAGRLVVFRARITGVAMTMAVGEVLSANINWEAIGAPTQMTL